MNSKKLEVPNHEQSAESLQVRIATESWEKREIYRLRYDVYVQEMGKPVGPSTNKDKHLADSLDDRSILLYTQAGNDMVATIRLTIAPPEDYPTNLSNIFQMHKFESLYTNQSSPKLAVTAAYRNSPALILLIAEAYRILRSQKVQYCLTIQQGGQLHE